MRMTEKKKESLLKSLWHGMIAVCGLYELFNPAPRSRTFRVMKGTLAVGLVAFHTDAAICDYLDKPTTLQRILYKLGGRT